MAQAKSRLILHRTNYTLDEKKNQLDCGASSKDLYDLRELNTLHYNAIVNVLLHVTTVFSPTDGSLLAVRHIGNTWHFEDISTILQHMASTTTKNLDGNRIVQIAAGTMFASLNIVYINGVEPASVADAYLDRQGNLRK